MSDFVFFFYFKLLSAQYIIFLHVCAQFFLQSKNATHPPSSRPIPDFYVDFEYGIGFQKSLIFSELRPAKDVKNSVKFHT